jgi:hypothetical protein
MKRPTRQIMIRASEQEGQAWEAAAFAARVTLTEWARGVLDREAKVPAEHLDELARDRLLARRRRPSGEVTPLPEPAPAPDPAPKKRGER